MRLRRPSDRRQGCAVFPSLLSIFPPVFIEQQHSALAAETNAFHVGGGKQEGHLLSAAQQNRTTHTSHCFVFPSVDFA